METIETTKSRYAAWIPRNDYERLYRILYPVDFYFDESGVHAGAPAFVMAGYLAQTPAWDDFKTKWSKALSDAGVAMEDFHMTDFESKHGPFKGWTTAQAIALQGSLLDIINDTTSMGICCAMTLSDYEAVVPEETRRKYGVRIPYTLCFMECLTGIQLYMKDYIETINPDAVVGFIFDQNQDFSPMMSSLFFSLKKLFGNPSWMSGVRFEDRRQYCQLQAADILAYEMFKHVSNVAHGFPRPMRKSLKRIDTVKVMKKRLDKDQIRHWTNYTIDSIAAAIEVSPPII